MVARVAVPSGPHPAGAAPDAAGVRGLLYAPCVALSYTLFQTKTPVHLLARVLAGLGLLLVNRRPPSEAKTRK